MVYIVCSVMIVSGLDQALRESIEAVMHGGRTIDSYDTTPFYWAIVMVFVNSKCTLTHETFTGKRPTTMPPKRMATRGHARGVIRMTTEVFMDNDDDTQSAYVVTLPRQNRSVIEAQ
jgi:hypothetical protein